MHMPGFLKLLSVCMYVCASIKQVLLVFSLFIWSLLQYNQYILTNGCGLSNEACCELLSKKAVFAIHFAV